MAQTNTLLIFVNTPTNTAELQKMCDEARRHYHAQADAIGVLATDLRSRLSKVANGSPVLFGLDSKMVARRVTKHLMLAADLNAQSARAFMACWGAYQEGILNVKQQANAGFTV
jgi:hypothetical protein